MALLSAPTFRLDKYDLSKPALCSSEEGAQREINWENCVHSNIRPEIALNGPYPRMKEVFSLPPLLCIDGEQG